MTPLSNGDGGLLSGASFNELCFLDWSISMRAIGLFASGLIVGFALQFGVAQEKREIVGLNHVAISVDNFDEATRFYSQTMGFRDAFAFREPDGTPTLAYLQVSRDTFIELMPSSAARPAGLVHVGLEVAHLDATLGRLRQANMEVRDFGVSPRTNSRIAMMTTPEGTNIELLELGSGSLHRKAMNAWK
jgi:catechol 2,3-dioxygenase-like lactoylglutathione lyase family enzyme